MRIPNTLLLVVAVCICAGALPAADQQVADADLESFVIDDAGDNYLFNPGKGRPLTITIGGTTDSDDWEDITVSAQVKAGGEWAPAPDMTTISEATSIYVPMSPATEWRLVVSAGTDPDLTVSVIVGSAR